MMGFLEFFHTNFPGEWGQRDEKFTVFLSQEMECTFSLALPIHGKKRPPNKQNTKTQNRKIPLSSVFISIAFCSSFRWTHGSLTNSGRSSAPTNTPQSMRRGIKGICLCLLVAWQYTFSYFSLSGRLFLFFLLQFCHQPNKRRTDEKYHMFFLGFISFLASPLL